ncbi:MAG: hypothetical protein M1830_005533 [Pleopsidium flavum]|nr:MAG: hypothetical protein M1830_005533 [Pleopsidium flavum]
MPTTKPAILIVHGAYQLPSTWTPFISTLRTAGFQTSCPRLPTCGNTRSSQATLADDVTAIRTAATELVSTGHKIIILAHSYGGVVASEAISPDLYASNLKNNGGGVVHLIYLSAWLVLKGQSVNSILEKYGFQSCVDVGFNSDNQAFVKNASDSFYNDIEPRSQAEELAEATVTHNWSAVGGKIEGAPWMNLPSTYVHCEQDQAILLDLQKSMVKDAMEAREIGGLETELLNSGHCPFLTALHHSQWPRAVLRSLEFSIEDFWQYRLGTSAVRVVLCLNEHCNETILPWHAVRDEDLATLWDLTNANICNVNDLLSVKKEIAKGSAESLIPILYATLRSAQAAADQVMKTVRFIITEFDLVASRLLQRFGSDDPTVVKALREFVEGCRYYCSGNLSWR